jgi:hypothetical protein
MKFEKQTYTQTPNSLFTMMKDMDECELKVVLLICRYTFGYHREEVKLSTRRISDEIGMNTASVQKGADKAIERGLIEKVIDGNKTTTWRALVSDSEIESQVIQKLNRGVSENESLSPIKESNKEKKETSSFSSQGNYINTIGNAIFVDVPVTQEIADAASLKDTAPKMFEAALGFSKPLPWWQGKEWTAFAEWVCAEYSKSKTSFGDYNIWRNTPYTKGGIANTRIRGFVNEFYDSWDMFRMSNPESPTLQNEPDGKGFYA